MTFRELKVFIDHLPGGSATHRSLYGEAATWTPETHLLAHLWDAYASSHWPRNRPFQPYPRPEVPDK